MEPLKIITADALHYFGHFGSLNAFRGDAEFHLLEGLNQGRQERIPVPIIVTDDLHINFNISKRILPDTGQVGITGAIIIQREFKTAVMQADNLLPHEREVDHRLFGNLQMDPVCANAVFPEHGSKSVRYIPGHELDRGEIDIDPLNAHGVHIVVADETADLGEYLLAEAGNITFPFGQGDEQIRPDDLTLLVSKTDEGFCGDSFTGSGIHDGLEENLQFVVIKRVFQAAADFQPFGDLLDGIRERTAAICIRSAPEFIKR